MDGTAPTTSSFAPWELTLANLIYWVIVPGMQYSVAICTMDTWQYFLHRSMHMNKWLYTTFHSRHHRLYVPYAFGALYNHPFEGFLLDTLGGAISYKVAGMNTRQGIWFFTGSTIKTVDDHCGYALPFDPLQHLTSNNAAYHDIHHQSWGIKTNFSQPFFIFWDGVLGTMWKGRDLKLRYERDALAAQKKVDADTAATTAGAAGEGASADTAISQDSHAEEPEDETEEAPQATPRKGNRRRTASSLNSDSLRGLRERVSIHGRTGGIIGVEHAH